MESFNLFKEDHAYTTDDSFYGSFAFPPEWIEAFAVTEKDKEKVTSMYFMAINPGAKEEYMPVISERALLKAVKDTKLTPIRERMKRTIEMNCKKNIPATTTAKKIDKKPLSATTVLPQPVMKKNQKNVTHRNFDRFNTYSTAGTLPRAGKETTSSIGSNVTTKKSRKDILHLILTDRTENSQEDRDFGAFITSGYSIRPSTVAPVITKEEVAQDGSTDSTWIQPTFDPEPYFLAYKEATRKPIKKKIIKKKKEQYSSSLMFI